MENTTKNRLQYKDYSPTSFDTKGAFLPDRQSWFVAPLAQTRDSGPLDKSNFDAAVKLLGGESDSVEVYRFGHWGPGWVEIILVDNAAADKVAVLDEIVAALEDYPVLDEEDFSKREWDDYLEAWENYGRSDFVSDILRPMINFDGVEDLITGADSQDLLSLFESGISSGEYYYTDGYQVCVNLKSCEISREQLADFIRDQKAKKAE